MVDTNLDPTVSSLFLVMEWALEIIDTDVYNEYTSTVHMAVLSNLCGGFRWRNFAFKMMFKSLVLTWHMFLRQISQKMEYE